MSHGSRIECGQVSHLQCPVIITRRKKEINTDLYFAGAGSQARLGVRPRLFDQQRRRLGGGVVIVEEAPRNSREAHRRQRERMQVQEQQQQQQHEQQHQENMEDILNMFLTD